jgi:outer membrane protein assembly factor BamB
MYPISPRFMEPRGADADAPGLEAGGRLYFFDQGMLTSFELRSGQVQWRLPNVGISQVLLPSGGRLYVAGTTAAPALIPTHKVIAFSEAVHPLLLQVDAGNGKVLWQLENVGERFHVGGKFVYTSRTQVSRLETMAAAMNQDDSPTPVHHRIYRLDPGKGKELWEYYRPKAPVFLEARHNRLLLQFPREVQVLKFLSL